MESVVFRSNMDDAKDGCVHETKNSSSSAKNKLQTYVRQKLLSMYLSFVSNSFQKIHDEKQYPANEWLFKRTSEKDDRTLLVTHSHEDDDDDAIRTINSIFKYALLTYPNYIIKLLQNKKFSWFENWPANFINTHGKWNRQIPKPDTIVQTYGNGFIPPDYRLQQYYDTLLLGNHRDLFCSSKRTTDHEIEQEPKPKKPRTTKRPVFLKNTLYAYNLHRKVVLNNSNDLLDLANALPSDQQLKLREKLQVIVDSVNSMSYDRKFPDIFYDSVTNKYSDDKTPDLPPNTQLFTFHDYKDDEGNEPFKTEI